MLQGKRAEANAAWWGFDPQESTQALQAAIRSGAKRVVVPRMPGPWIVDKIELESDQEIFFEPGVEVVAKGCLPRPRRLPVYCLEQAEPPADRARGPLSGCTATTTPNLPTKRQSGGTCFPSVAAITCWWKGLPWPKAAVTGSTLLRAGVENPARISSCVM